MFVSDLRQVGGFVRVLRFNSSIKLLKVALNTINQTKQSNYHAITTTTTRIEEWSLQNIYVRTTLKRKVWLYREADFSSLNNAISDNDWDSFLDDTIDVIMFVSDLRQVGGFVRVLRFNSSIKLLKVALNTINQTKPFLNGLFFISCIDD
jgi:hypothetical protein